MNCDHSDGAVPTVGHCREADQANNQGNLCFVGAHNLRFLFLCGPVSMLSLLYIKYRLDRPGYSCTLYGTWPVPRSVRTRAQYYPPNYLFTGAASIISF